MCLKNTSRPKHKDGQEKKYKRHRDMVKGCVQATVVPEQRRRKMEQNPKFEKIMADSFPKNDER